MQLLVEIVNVRFRFRRFSLGFAVNLGLRPLMGGRNMFLVPFLAYIR